MLLDIADPLARGLSVALQRREREAGINRRFAHIEAIVGRLNGDLRAQSA